MTTDGPLDLSPNLNQAQQTALMAHAVVIRLKEMGLPDDMDGELGNVCTDLADVWAAQKMLSERLEYLTQSARTWDDIGDCLVDLKAVVEHMSTHVESVKGPIERLATYAYERADEG